MAPRLSVDLGQPMHSPHRNKFKELVDTVLENESEIVRILAEYQPVRVTKYEIDHYIHALENFDEIDKHFSAQANIKITSFLPSNLPLYSLLLFAVIPSYVSRSVIVRGNSALLGKASLKLLFKILKLEVLCPNVALFVGDRDDFVNKHVSESDLIIFTGRNETRELIKEYMKEGAFLINNGSGHNPIVVTETARIDDAVNGVTYSKFFNSGQDCAGPDAVLVHEKVKEEFLLKLKETVSSLKVGDHFDEDVIVGRIERKEELERLKSLVESNQEKIFLGKPVDVEKKIVYPTIIVSEITDGNLNFSEIFGPVLFVYIYQEEEQLKLYFEDKAGKYMQNKMYVTFFSEKLKQRVNARDVGIVLHNKIILNKDTDNAFTPYGGFSRGASAILERKNGKTNSVATPVFLPEVIRKIFVEKKQLKDTVLPKHIFKRNEVQDVKRDVSIDFINGVRETFGKNLVFGFIIGDVTKSIFERKGCEVNALVCVNVENSEERLKFASFLKKLNCKFGFDQTVDFDPLVVQYSHLVSWMHDLLHKTHGENYPYSMVEHQIKIESLWDSQYYDERIVLAIKYAGLLANDKKVALTCQNKAILKALIGDAKNILLALKGIQ